MGIAYSFIHSNVIGQLKFRSKTAGHINWFHNVGNVCVGCGYVCATSLTCASLVRFSKEAGYAAHCWCLLGHGNSFCLVFCFLCTFFGQLFRIKARSLLARIGEAVLTRPRLGRLVLCTWHDTTKLACHPLCPEHADFRELAAIDTGLLIVILMLWQCELISAIEWSAIYNKLVQNHVLQSLVICLDHRQFNSTCKAKCLSLPDVGTA